MRFGTKAKSSTNHASTTVSSAAVIAKLIYSSSGIKIYIKEASLVALLRALRTVGNEHSTEQSPTTVGAPVADPGGFYMLIEFGDNLLLSMCTDGVAIDVVDMNLNYLLCVGDHRMAFIYYIIAPKPDLET